MTLEALLSKNRPLRGAHAGRRCFIVGNGPSLAAQDLLPMRDDVKITVSSFFRHPQAQALRPDYWVLADPNFWLQPARYFEPALKQAQQAAVPTKLFVPTGGVACFAAAPLGPLIDLFFYHFDGTCGIDRPIDLTRGVPPFGQNVIVPALMIALYLGCDPIYLVGCDHDFMKWTREQYHGTEVAHFYPGAADPRSADPASDHLTWDQWSAAMKRMIFEYEQLRNYAERWGHHVFNATRGGGLEVFPRVAYESLFAPGPNGAAAVPAEPMGLAQAAIERLNGGDAATALVLVDAALARNVGRPDRVEGLEYVKALCLARLGRMGEAVVLARQDRLVNPANAHKAQALLAELEDHAG